jgi:dUTP pyrophosphatase
MPYNLFFKRNKMKVPVELKILDERIRENLPSYGTQGSAGLDLRACLNSPLTLQPGEVELISTGLSLFINNASYCATILPRSGLGHKKGLVLGNLVGLIDSDYQGPLMVSAWNRSQTAIVIEPMDRIAQLVILPVIQADFKIVDEFAPSARGECGFGSTGTH